VLAHQVARRWVERQLFPFGVRDEHAPEEPVGSGRP
jgi:hypothetical protein